MTVPEPAELKRKLRAEGFDIYRTASQAVHLAERVRDNLIMDSGISADLSAREEGEIRVQVTVRAQASHFPGANVEQMQLHASELAQAFKDSGYDQVEVSTSPVPDPSDPEKSLDTSHEIMLTRLVPDLSGLFAELKAALSRPRSTSDD